MSGGVVWLTGLPAAGKSTLAARVRVRLVNTGRAACVLDGDEVRRALVPAPGYGDAERAAFYQTLANLAALLADQGFVVLVPATAHRRSYRAAARAAAKQFLEVYVASSASECAKRDIKGLYAAALEGQLSDLPGVDASYETPQAPDLVVEGGLDANAPARIIALLG